MLSNFPGCVPIIPRKMRLLPFSSNATKFLDTVSASQDMDPLSCLNKKREKRPHECIYRCGQRTVLCVTPSAPRSGRECLRSSYCVPSHFLE